MQAHPISEGRPGFIMVEMIASLAVLLVLMTVIGQVAGWSMQERARLSARLAALEFADNLLEAARARPFKELDASWAAGWQIPGESSFLPSGAEVEVRVEPERAVPRLKRVTVTVRWPGSGQAPQEGVELFALFGPSAEERK